MSKRKSRDSGGVHQTRSFEQMVADATLGKFSSYIDGEIQVASQAILARQQQANNNLYARLVAVEEVLMERLGMTTDQLSDKVAEIQDRSEGLVQAHTVEKGDRVRVEIKTRTEDQPEFQGASRLLIENTGSGFTIGPQLESAIVGMLSNETKDVVFGKDNSMVASIRVSRISRKPKPQVVAEPVAETPAVETQAPEAPQVTERTPDVSANAG